ncbi:hypothetical protein [Flocculibacter collagenilyticus]|uniref:hypothetical protein n=1 Tax=Flocculibacter collagenilyticus TaxID=2744479 RepID=UPI0018F37EF8|nr:hypothetical protein [Flocculibacter collagenilyticus]
MEQEALQKEWSLLQNQFDSYEKYSLMIKLLSISVLTAMYITHSLSVFSLLLLGIIWGQDAIWKTFQSRIEPRLLQIESSLVNCTDQTAFQFNSEYQKSASTGLGLIGEYCRQAIRPTIAFPHVVLILLASVALFVLR